MKQFIIFTTLSALCLAIPCNITAQNPFEDKQDKQPLTDIQAPQHPGVISHKVEPLFGRAPSKSPNYRTLPPLTKDYLVSNETSISAIHRSPKTGNVIFITRKVSTSRSSIDDDTQAFEVAYSELEALAGPLGLDDPRSQFSIDGGENDELQYWHIKFNQHHQGIPIYGAQLIVHLQPDGYSIVNGRHLNTIMPASVDPSLSEQLAESIAMGHLSSKTKVRELSTEEKTLLNYPGPYSELVIYNKGLISETTHLAWHLTIRPNFIERWEFFVDAHSGTIINHFNHTCSLGPVTAQAQDLNGVNQTINVFESGGTYYMLDASRPMYNGSLTTLPQSGSGSIVTLDLQNTTLQNPQAVDVTSSNNVWNHPTAVSAHTNASTSYEYFRTTFARNSINGTGGDIVSFVNVADDNGGGLDNAFWNGEQMFYGNGAVSFFPLAASLDVGGHEMTHGVVQNTANLEYQDEPGALNESFADVFGVMIDRDDWQLGEGVVKTSYIPTGFLRDLADPHNGGFSLNDPGWQPAHTNEQYIGQQDNGGVHINSGIPNHAFYLVATSIGKDKAEQIYYRALSQYLTMSSRFIDARLAVVQAATDLHGASSTEVNACKSSFDQVGIMDGSGGDYEDDLPINPGQDYILFHDVDPSNPTQMYISNTTGTAFTAVTQIMPINKASVTDDGMAAVFVANDNNMHAVDMSTATPVVSPITDDDFWDNAAVSKNGNKLAGISTFIDTSIYIFHYGLQQWVQFILYNPTFGQGVNMGGVLYADAVEWDYSGEYLMYDAFNVIPNAVGSDIDYWDVGFIHVWDNNAHTWGTGEITKLFGGLPEGVSIGNPSFAKNSPYVVCFDLFDLNTNEAKVIAVNIETGDIGTVWIQSILGFPSYSKNDDKLVFSALNSSSEPIIAEVNMQSDKITPAGNATTLIDLAELPVWFTQGSRVVGMEEPGGRNTNPRMSLFPNPADAWVMLSLNGRSFAADDVIKVYDMAGCCHHSQVIEHSSKVVALTVSSLPAGVYVVEAHVDDGVVKGKLVKGE